MLNQLLEVLKTFDGVEYLINEVTEQRLECYNIKKKPEMKRSINVTNTSLTLYNVFDDGKYRGSYNTQIHPGTGTEELKTIITEGLYAAGFVKNAYFPLVSADAAKTYNYFDDINTLQTLEKLQEAFYADDNHDKGHLSYGEFFISRHNNRQINSNGVDNTYISYTASVETAVHWKKEDGSEIEVFENFNVGLDLDDPAAYVKERMEKLFATSKNKAVAVPTPDVGEINILLSGDCLATFFGYYRTRANAQMVYQQLSTYKEGDTVQGADNDKITITLAPHMKGAYSPYDGQGFPLESHEIIKDGKLTKIHGDTRFAHYLNITPTGNIGNIHVTGGTYPTNNLCKEPYLELVSFSDFQANPITGDFGSEIRLGYYFDGNKITPVTGGSISGNMEKVHNSLRMSKEEQQYGGYKGPATVCITGASISAVV